MMIKGYHHKVQKEELIMKFYSENLKKFFDTEKECLAAEEESKRKAEVEAKKKEELANARKERAKAIDEAREVMIKAEKDYNKLVREFIKDYGSYHFSYSSNDVDDDELNDLFDSLFRLF